MDTKTFFCNRIELLNFILQIMIHIYVIINNNKYIYMKLYLNNKLLLYIIYKLKDVWLSILKINWHKQSQMNCWIDYSSIVVMSKLKILLRGTKKQLNLNNVSVYCDRKRQSYLVASINFGWLREFLNLLHLHVLK